MNSTKVSLVVPVLNEEGSIEQLIDDILHQSFPPDEVVIVDGGSTDRTVELIEKHAEEISALKLIKEEEATPGKGRNIGIAAAENDWIALTDAGIRLEEDWLEQLCERANGRTDAIGPDRQIDIVYGDYDPVVSNFFEKCACLSYVTPKTPRSIRGKFVASTLLRKEIWKKVGGFPDMRSAEDLIFMEAVEAAGFGSAVAPKALVHWELRPDLVSTFRKFVLYSEQHVWAHRLWDWHYGIVRKYLWLLPFLLLSAMGSWWFLLSVPIWLALTAAKRIAAHHHEFGWSALFDPRIFLSVAGLVLVIDAATFLGWMIALVTKADIDVKENSTVGAIR